MPDEGQTVLIVDCFARWRISDPLLFYNRLSDERSALSRLDDILGSETPQRRRDQRSGRDHSRHQRPPAVARSKSWKKAARFCRARIPDIATRPRRDRKTNHRTHAPEDRRFSTTATTAWSPSLPTSWKSCATFRLTRCWWGASLGGFTSMLLAGEIRRASPAPWCSSTSCRTWSNPGRTGYTPLWPTGWNRGSRRSTRSPMRSPSTTRIVLDPPIWTA